MKTKTTLLPALIAAVAVLAGCSTQPPDDITRESVAKSPSTAEGFQSEFRNERRTCSAVEEIRHDQITGKRYRKDQCTGAYFPLDEATE